MGREKLTERWLSSRSSSRGLANAADDAAIVAADGTLPRPAPPRLILSKLAFRPPLFGVGDVTRIDIGSTLADRLCPLGTVVGIVGTGGASEADGTLS